MATSQAMQPTSTKKHKADTGGSFSVRSNEMIQKARYMLSADEENIVCFAASLIDFAATEFEYIEFKIQDLLIACNQDPRSGNNREKIRNAFTSLQSKVIEVTEINENGEIEDVFFNWLSESTLVRSGKGYSKCKLKFHPNLKPYFLQQQKNFTKIYDKYALPLKHNFTKRLYMYCKSRAFKSLRPFTFYIAVDELMHVMGVEEPTEKGKLILDGYYKDWSKFKSRRLDVAIKAINEGTDIKISYTRVEDNNITVGVQLTVTHKEGLELVSTDMFLKGMTPEETVVDT